MRTSIKIGAPLGVAVIVAGTVVALGGSSASAHTTQLSPATVSTAGTQKYPLTLLLGANAIPIESYKFTNSTNTKGKETNSAIIVKTLPSALSPALLNDTRDETVFTSAKLLVAAAPLGGTYYTNLIYSFKPLVVITSFTAAGTSTPGSTSYTLSVSGYSNDTLTYTTTPQPQ